VNLTCLIRIELVLFNTCPRPHAQWLAQSGSQDSKGALLTVRDCRAACASGPHERHVYTQIDTHTHSLSHTHTLSLSLRHTHTFICYACTHPQTGLNLGSLMMKKQVSASGSTLSPSPRSLGKTFISWSIVYSDSSGRRSRPHLHTFPLMINGQRSL